MELLFAAMMLAAVAFVLLSGVARQRRNERLVARRLRGEVIRESRIGSLLRLLGDTRIGQRSISLDSKPRYCSTASAGAAPVNARCSQPARSAFPSA